MSAAVRPDDRGGAIAGGVATLAELMTWALWLELDAAERYHDLAGAMETHNNDEVADLFRRMAAIEERYADAILRQMRWLAPPPLPSGPPPWSDREGPESVSHGDVHYLMRPWHALALALKGEQRAARFFAALAAQAADPAIRAAAESMAGEEREHVALAEAWMAKVPRPDERWQDDPAPPRYLD